MCVGQSWHGRGGPPDGPKRVVYPFGIEVQAAPPTVGGYAKSASAKGFRQRRRPDSNRGITDLQSAALPLGYGAGKECMLTAAGFFSKGLLSVAERKREVNWSGPTMGHATR